MVVRERQVAPVVGRSRVVGSLFFFPYYGWLVIYLFKGTDGIRGSEGANGLGGGTKTRVVVFAVSRVLFLSHCRGASNFAS